MKTTSELLSTKAKLHLARLKVDSIVKMEGFLFIYREKMSNKKSLMIKAICWEISIPFLKRMSMYKLTFSII